MSAQFDQPSSIQEYQYISAQEMGGIGNHQKPKQEYQSSSLAFSTAFDGGEYNLRLDQLLWRRMAVVITIWRQFQHMLGR